MASIVDIKSLPSGCYKHREELTLTEFANVVAPTLAHSPSFSLVFRRPQGTANRGQKMRYGIIEASAEGLSEAVSLQAVLESFKGVLDGFAPDDLFAIKH